MNEKTVVIQIGNSDDKLSQREWKDFCNYIHKLVEEYSNQIHFSAPSVGWADWQNCAWVFTMSNKNIRSLKINLEDVRIMFRQDSIAWTEGKTELLGDATQ
jgi:nitrate/TMAO reductase-like tetraheme cytochrome c subunit